MEELTINSTNTSRFSGATWFNRVTQCRTTVVGLGGIGSYVVLLLSRLNVLNIDMFDGDKVEEVNLAGQLFSTSDIGQYKGNSVRELIKNYSNYYKSNNYNCFFELSNFCQDITFCGLDNMEARQTVFNSWLRNKSGIFIDGRLSAEEYQIFAIKWNDVDRIKEYKEKWLFTDSEADATICSYKQTSFIAMNIASNMINIFVNYIYNLTVNKEIRCVPFYTEFEGPILDYTNIEYKIGVSEITPEVIEPELPTQLPEFEPVNINTSHATAPPIPTPAYIPNSNIEAEERAIATLDLLVNSEVALPEDLSEFLLNND